MKGIVFLLMILVTMMGACKQSDKAANDHKDEKATTEATHEDIPDGVSLTKEQVAAIKLETTTISQKQLTATLRANGVLKVPNQNKATVTSLYGGVIKKLLVQTGSNVGKGQVIATIENPQFLAMQEEYLTVVSNISLAEQELNRQKELTTGNAGALKNLQQSETQLRNLYTRKASLQRQLSLAGISTEQLSNDNMTSVLSVKSPVAGAVSTILVNIGSYVDINTPVADIVDNSQLHLDLFVYEKDLPLLKVGQVIHFTQTNNPNKEYDAEIFGISKTFENDAKAVAVHARVKGNKTGLIDGMSITGLVSLNNVTVPAIPTDAIVSYQGVDFVFVAMDKQPESEEHKDDNHDNHDHGKDEHGDVHEDELYFLRVPVRKGTTDVGYSEITLLKDVPANTKIVTKGAFFLLAKMTNAGDAHEH